MELGQFPYKNTWGVYTLTENDLEIPQISPLKVYVKANLYRVISDVDPDLDFDVRNRIWVQILVF
jgi:hypothetical protein